jgi:hypothetical protein
VESTSLLPELLSERSRSSSAPTASSAPCTIAKTHTRDFPDLFPRSSQPTSSASNRGDGGEELTMPEQAMDGSAVKLEAAERVMMWWDSASVGGTCWCYSTARAEAEWFL